MTPNEFKAFLEGMDISGSPTPEQWERIKAKIDLLRGGLQGSFNIPAYPPARPLDPLYPPGKPWMTVCGVSCNDEGVEVHA